MSHFNEGDIVIICMSNSKAFGWTAVKARIEYSPHDVGDSWQFTILERGELPPNKRVLINPCCSTFAGLILLPALKE